MTVGDDRESLAHNVDLKVLSRRPINIFSQGVKSSSKSAAIDPNRFITMIDILLLSYCEPFGIGEEEGAGVFTQGYLIGRKLNLVQSGQQYPMA